MFLKVYKTTIKNLTRSAIFWLVLIFSVFCVLNWANKGMYLGDNKDDFVFLYDKYMTDLTLNTIRTNVMLYAMPIFAVLSTSLALANDYINGFFEIERAGGVKPSQYFFGRLSAIVSINIIVSAVSAFAAFHWYVFSRGGVEGMALREYLSDSTVRFLRVYCFCAIPAILTYIGVTYLISSLFKNGLVGTIGGASYALLIFLCNAYLDFRMPMICQKFFNPRSNPVYTYWSWYDLVGSKWDSIINFAKNIFGTSTTGEVLIWTSVMLGTSFLCYAVSYLYVRNRKT